MCGRFAAYSKPTEIAKIFSIRQSFSFEQSYNIAPTENVSVVIALPDGERRIAQMRWGLIPHWQNSPTQSAPLINARIETIHSKPSFRQACIQRRCLIIADGFYEWRNIGQKKRQPYYIHQKDQQPFALAGIWERWISASNTIDSCCIITLTANDILMPLHDRMPAIVAAHDYSAWLDPHNKNWDEVKKLLTSDPHENLIFHEVSMKVNSAKYKGDDCIDIPDPSSDPH